MKSKVFQSIRSTLWTTFMFLAGSTLLAFLVAAFVSPHGIIMAGTTGIGLALCKFLPVDTAIVVLALNILMLLLGLFALGKKFFLATIASSLLYPVLLAVMQRIPGIESLTEDPLLAAILGGGLLGLALGMVMRVGASTGGTEATLQVLEQLPADIPGMVITQHMPEGFTQMYAQRLNRLCKMEVKEAVNGDIVRRGLVLIAPGGECQMKVVRVGTNYTVRIYPGEKVSGHRPSVDVLFQSVAQAAKSGAVGIILTGMGQDGAYGLLDMHKAGAYTIGQDKESCVVYGMPMVAQNIGAVTIQASCANIPSVLMNYLNTL